MRKQTRRNVDYRELGYRTAKASHDDERTRAICSLHIGALADELGPDKERFERAIEERRAQGQALASQLYARHTPVRDAEIFGKLTGVALLMVLFLASVSASGASHALTFILFGWSSLVSILVGLTLTGIAVAAGHLLFVTVLDTRPALVALIAVISAVLCYAGLAQLAQARGDMAGISPKQEQTGSFVDDSPKDQSVDDNSATDVSTAESVRALLGAALTKLLLAADAIAGILLGLIGVVLSNPDVAAWRRLRALKRELGSLSKARSDLTAEVEVAKKQCLAGVLEGRSDERKHPPYLQITGMMLMIGLGTNGSSFAQGEAHRHEAILIDFSGSVGKKAQATDLFHEYLTGVRTLIATEPSGSRLWVEMISAESFGSVSALLRGWTPSPQGVFTDALDRARRQLVASFESKVTGTAPTAAGTDILGSLFRAKTYLESGTGATKKVTKEIFVFSDMVNESPEFMMPALSPSGAPHMLEIVRSNKLIVPLGGYRVHVFGASPSGMNPQLWNTTKLFWTLYFRDAGAELLTYSADTSVRRQ